MAKIFFSGFIIGMNIISQNEISFGQVVPTEPLLKSALGIHKFDDAKILNQSIGVKYSGHISFYQRAIKIADEIISKNPELKKIVTELKTENITERQIKAIKSAVARIGENIDVAI